ncbi:DUF2189 domain-containing protein [Rhodoferax antarcticus]|uniref:DUF2189 domain-containing protein n=1 Tax=Rhodoferax antarcticus TaxID=81479 RepID=UPI002225970A|nr:DUF2189 domain-containing protein [Rhodoferax antarcticus]MCW2313733.1 putative membrane protein [Rhodoferax antarcticus]
MPNVPSKVLPAQHAAFAGVRTVALSQPLRWLGLGWKDLWRGGWLSLMHGVVMALMGAILLGLAGQRFWFLVGAFSGFLLVAPILATSLYAISRAIARGELVRFALILRTWLNWQNGRVVAWDAGHWRLVKFGLLLAVAGTVWVLTSASLITLMASVPITTPMAFIEHVVLAPQGYLFELWLALGGMLVAPIFASTVITVPLLLDRDISVKQAVLSSWQVVVANPLPMAFWGALIMGLTLLGFASALVGLIVLVPLLGHASWHAYRDLIDASALPEREPG